MGRAALLASMSMLLAVLLCGCRTPSPADSTAAVRTDSPRGAPQGAPRASATSAPTASGAPPATGVRGRRNITAGRSFGDDGAAILNRIEIQR
jgi:hypothetical protein